MVETLFHHARYFFDRTMGEYSRYLVAAGLLFLLLAVWRRAGTQRFKIHAGHPRAPQMRREMLNSLMAAAVFECGKLGVLAIALFAFDKPKPDLGAPMSPWLVAASFPLMLVLHDTYFYWTHRLMHLPAVFKAVHWEHHKSQKPSPWTAYSFSLPEALVQGLFLPIYVMTMPVNGTLVVMFLAVEILHNAAIHSGLELFPRWLVSHPVTGWLAGTTHHDIHHGTSRCNYGLYFRFWDRLMGTEHAQFVPVYEYVRSPQNDGRAFRLLSQGEATEAAGTTKPAIDF